MLIRLDKIEKTRFIYGCNFFNYRVFLLVIGFDLLLIEGFLTGAFLGGAFLGGGFLGGVFLGGDFFGGVFEGGAFLGGAAFRGAGFPLGIAYFEGFFTIAGAEAKGLPLF